MSKRVLLARPHPQIRPQMEPFLQGLGATVEVLEGLDALPAVKGPLAGVVISTAVRATLDASYPTVFAAVVERFGEAPVLFATLGGAPRRCGPASSWCCARRSTAPAWS